MLFFYLLIAAMLAAAIYLGIATVGYFTSQARALKHERDQYRYIVHFATGVLASIGSGRVGNPQLDAQDAVTEISKMENQKLKLDK